MLLCELKLLYDVVDSPVGSLTVAVDKAGALKQLNFGSDLEVQSWFGAACQRDPGAVAEPLKQLREYFDGSRKVFELRLDPNGTGFQKAVWSHLLTIPFGVTRTYGEVARAIGSPESSRAVGAANGANPIAIIIPCHRVIGASGKLVGYGGGLDLKAKLLEFEQVGTPSLFAGEAL